MILVIKYIKKCITTLGLEVFEPRAIDRSQTTYIYMYIQITESITPPSPHHCRINSNFAAIFFLEFSRQSLSLLKY